LKDERFFDNPLVTEDPHIRFYAGQQLRPFGEQAIGTLCIIDRVPREFSADDRQIFVDLAKMVERKISAVQLSVIDELTRISNRRGFLALARYSLDVCMRHQFPASLLFFDLDRFKEINDTYGHAEGDKALKIFTTQMRDTFRMSDIYARFGGDEFVVLLSNTSVTMTQQLIMRFQANLQTKCEKLGLPYSIQFSHGVIAFNPLKHKRLEDMLQEADAAMYAHKALKQKNISW
jgi:diguanylate cyclase (GGDEF)-like protein